MKTDESSHDIAELEPHLLAAAVQQSPVSVVVTDLQARLTFVNDYFCQVTGYQANEVLGQNPRLLQSGMTPKSTYQDMWRQLAAGQTWRGELLNRRKNGEFYWEFAQISPVKNRQGEVSHYVGIKENIDQRKHAESQLAESERNFRTLFEEIEDFLFVTDDAGNIIIANQQVLKRLGYSAAELHGQPVLQVHPPQQRKLAQRIVGEMLAGTTRTCPVPLMTRDGTLIPVETRVSQGTWDGKPALFGVSRDLSEIKASEEKFSRSFQLSPLAMAISELQDGTFLDVNQAFEKLTGHAADQVLGKNALTLGIFSDPHDREALVQRVLQDGIVQNQPVTIRTRDGGTRHGLMSAGLLLLQDRRLLLTQMLDITESKAATERQRLAASVFTHAYEGIMICDAARNIVEVNPAFTNLTGYAPVEVLGKNPSLLSSGRHPPAFFQQMFQSIEDFGFWQGEIWNRHKDGEVYAILMSINVIRDNKDRITHYISVFSDITLLKDQQKHLEQLAHHDALTRLPNRALLADRMSQALTRASREQGMLAICYLDLDNFKPVNDQHGHQTGDLLLMEMARRLSESVRSSDTVARLGGDEFVLLLVNPTNLDECVAIATRVLHALAAPCLIEGKELRVSGSMGITIYPDDQGDAATLLHHADLALYQAKQSGRNCYHLFNPDMDQDLQQRREQGQLLQQALHGNQLQLHYQPLFDMRQSKTIGLEVLLRWQHPQRGLLAAEEFLPSLNDPQLALAIDRWVFRNALEQYRQRLDQDIDLPISINLSAASWAEDKLPDELQALLATYPEIAAENISLEIRETDALEDIEHSGKQIRACQRIGLRVSLDDFGSGYSSLSFFRRMPVDTLKIDGTFTRGMLDEDDQLATVESIVALTRAFRRRIVAEGVETTATAAVLLHMGCDVAQGHEFARPMPNGRLSDWLQGFRPEPGWKECLSWQWSSEDVPLTIMGLEHQRWIRQLEQMLRNEEVIDSPQLDSTRCRFGAWYRGSGRQRYGDFEEFRLLAAPHEQVHALAKEILERHRRGEEQQAKRLLGELHELRDQLAEGVLLLMVRVSTENN